MKIEGAPKFGIGGASRRVEDDLLTRGQGRYTADVNADRQLFAYFLRADCAHADFHITSIDEAKAAEGVHLVWTGADVASYGPMPIGAKAVPKQGAQLNIGAYPLICVERVRKVGDVVAIVVAETALQAQEAAELIEVDYDFLPAVTETSQALNEDAPLVWPQFGSNLAYEAERGDPEATDRAFAKASQIAKLRVVHNRLISNYMEPRAALAEYDGDADHWTLTIPSQGVHVMQRIIAEALGVSTKQLRVRTFDVGGAFGPKYFAYRDYPLVALAAKATGRPVKWVSTRMEHFLADAHGRDVVVDAELAIDENGRAIGLRAHWAASMGAYVSQYGSYVPYLGASMTPGVYDIPATHVVIKGVYTNNTPTDAYRGAGRPEAAFTIERLMDEGARLAGLSPVEFRRRNFIKPEQMPYRTPTGQHYDSGEFEAQLDAAMKLADYDGFAARRIESARRGKLRGFGFATYIEACAFKGSEPAIARLRQDGVVELRIGTQAGGQGHKTVYGQFIAEALGVDFDKIVVLQGDTDHMEKGGGTAGSRSIPLGVPSVRQAATVLASKVRQRAAEVLETEAGNIDLEDGVAFARGTNRYISFADLAKKVDGAEVFTGTGEFIQHEATYPNGTHVCELEIDPETGTIDLLSIDVVDDFGVVINPILLEGQIQGGIAQGLGQAVLERTVYDESGQLLSASFMDYAMPRATDIPKIRLETHNVPCVWNEMGIKGGGEAGAIGATPAIANAIVNALYPEFGITNIELPATPERVWRAIEDAKVRQNG